MVLTKERFSIETRVRGYQAGVTVLSYLHLLCDQREVQASPFRLILCFNSFTAASLTTTRGWLVIEDHEDRGHCQRDTGIGRESHSLVGKTPS